MDIVKDNLYHWQTLEYIEIKNTTLLRIKEYIKILHVNVELHISKTVKQNIKKQNNIDKG